MLVVVRFLRYRGRILPWREVVNRPALAGDLRVKQSYDEDLRRHLRIARLLDPTTPGHAKMPPSLYDVQLIGMSPSALSLSGFERVLGVEYAQSWLLRTFSRHAEVGYRPRLCENAGDGGRYVAAGRIGRDYGRGLAAVKWASTRRASEAASCEARSPQLGDLPAEFRSLYSWEAARS